jgi:putative effector of murein hydrolase
MMELHWHAAWQALIHHPLFGVGITLTAFQLAFAAYEKTRWVFLQPVLVSMLLVVGILLLCGIDYAEYRISAQWLTLLLGPATVALAWAFGADEMILMTLAPKSVTSPIAMLVAEQIGGVVALAAVFVMITGVLGAILGPELLRRFGVQHPAARGIALGLTAHAVGTAQALQESDECGAFAALAMSLMGVMTAVLLPLAVALLL